MTGVESLATGLVDELAEKLVEAFSFILVERMAGIPILNEKLEVEAVEFSEYEGRPFGVIITPWMMNLIMLPSLSDDWSGMKTGDVQTYQFPAGVREFQVNEIEGAGVVQSHSLYSPMFRFVNQDHARAAARQCLKELMIEIDPEKQLDEERLKQFIEGGNMPEPEAGPEMSGEGADGAAPKSTSVEPASKIARSDFLRGRFAGDS